jgi:putative transposase
LPHHITQRGNNRTDVFFSDDDRKRYLQITSKYCAEYKLAIWAYCLMSNHVHLLAVPEYNYSLAQGMGRISLIYTQYVNLTGARCGRLWQNRFFSCPISREEYLWAVVRYIERNPVRAQLVKAPWEYPWSSARHHVLGEPDPLVAGAEWLEPERRSEYQSYLAGEDELTADLIRSATSTGRPLGGPEFIAELERKLCRVLQPKPGGRPRTL